MDTYAAVSRVCPMAYQIELGASPVLKTPHSLRCAGDLHSRWCAGCAGGPHRWETAGEADPSGRQLTAIRNHLRAHPAIRYVWVDVLCLPQGADRSAAEKDAFNLQLPHVNLLYMGATVLVLFDRLYASRFWCAFEAWLAFSMATADRGLVGAPTGRRRAAIVPLDEECDPAELEREWCDCSAHVAHTKLQGAGICVTNGADKIVQLVKVYELDQSVRRVMG